jgi:D-glycero-D-manno-heptose 1,7-bisphosphate phosphatase
MRPAVFLERDGILNLVRVERGHQVTPLTVDDFRLNPEALLPVRQLKQGGFLLIATTCQPGLSRGYQSRRELDQMHALLCREFPLEDILVCPHDETDRCPCRKPKPGLLIEAAFRWHLDLEHSFVISDKWRDAEAARNAGCTSILIHSPWNGYVHPDFVVPSLRDAAPKILQLRASVFALAGHY